jgi:protein TonB
VAFEAFRRQDLDRPRKLRRIAFVLVAIFHGVLVAAGIVYSYWHVEELTPPTLRVTFMSAPPPPPPPPPAAGGGGRPKKVALKPKLPEPVKPTEIVQPPEKTKPVKHEFRKHTDEYVEEDNTKTGVGAGKGKGSIEDGDEDGEEDGVKGGQRGGVIGGTIGSAGTTPAPPRSMPSQFGALQKISGDDPDFPPSLNHGGMEYIVEAKICVSTTGSVESVTVTKTADRLLDDSVLAKVRTWRFRPMRFNNMLVAFCYPGRFEFKSGR